MSRKHESFILPIFTPPFTLAFPSWISPLASDDRTGPVDQFSSVYVRLSMYMAIVYQRSHLVAVQILAQSHHCNEAAWLKKRLNFSNRPGYTELGITVIGTC